MEEKHLFHGRYSLTRLLGRGNFSEVWLAGDIKTGTNVALKVYAPSTGLDNDGLDVFAREFAIVAGANHNSLLKPLHYDTCDRKPYLVLPYCQNGSALKRIGLFKESEIWKLLHDVAGGLDFLHSMQPPVIHQDIKPDNIMLSDSGDYMLADFGISSHCKSALRKTVGEAFASAGTTAYMAPERFGKNGNVPIMASDIYSLAATAFELLTGNAPFGNDGGLMQKKGADVPELPDSYSTGLRKVIGRCLSSEPWKRPTAAELRQYAECGMKGEHVLMKGERPLARRFLPVAITALIVIAGLAYCGYYYYDRNSRRETAAAIEQTTKAYNDSIEGIMHHHVEAGTRLYESARLKEENYDRLLISARKEYVSAISQMGKLRGAADIEYGKFLKRQLSEINKSLTEAYKEMRAKAEFFKDDEPTRAEFEERANNIVNVLNNKQ